MTTPDPGSVDWDKALLHPSRLFHIGVVADDIEKAMAEMSRSMGLTWKGGRSTTMDLVIDGEHRQIDMRIAHAVEGPPHIELIEARPGTPWSPPHGTGVHHVCYWSDNAAATCAALEQSGHRRILGPAGSAGGYFLSPAGMIIEIISAELHDHLSGWITR